MKVAIVGAGKIGNVHARAYRASGARTVAAVEPNKDIGEAFANEYGSSHYLDFDALLNSDDRPDVVSICSPPSTHRSLIEKCIEAGIAVLCEKPLAHTIEDAEAIAQLCRRSSVTVGAAYCHRFQPEVAVIHDMIENGTIGTVRAFYSSFSGNQPDIERRWFGRRELSGGGVVIDTGIHSIDLFRYLCGEIVDATGIASSVLDAVPLEVEHTATLGLRSATQVIGTIDCSWKSPGGHWDSPGGTAILRVSGTTGVLEFDYAKPGIVLHTPATCAPEHIHVEQADRFARQAAYFLDAVQSGKPPRTGIEDALAGMKAVTQVYQQWNPASRAQDFTDHKDSVAG